MEDKTNELTEEQLKERRRYEIAREWVWGIALVGYALYPFTELM